MARGDWLGSKVSGHQVLVLHSSNEPGEPPQWQRHDDSTIDTVVTVAITMT